MVDRAIQRTNRSYLYDFIPIILKPSRQKPDVFRDLYLKGLSSSQIANQIGCSKTLVLDRLKKIGVDLSESRLTNPKNYRLAESPYGFSLRDGFLVPNKREMKVLRLIVHLRLHQDLSFENIARELIRKKIKNRRGKVVWQYCVVRKYFHRWKEKI